MLISVNNLKSPKLSLYINPVDCTESIPLDTIAYPSLCLSLAPSWSFGVSCPLSDSSPGLPTLFLGSIKVHLIPPVAGNDLGIFL